MLPERTAKLLATVDTSHLPGTLAEEHSCVGAKFHSPTPLIVHQVDVGGRTVWMCGTCRDNLAVYQTVLAHDPEWRTRREFGNALRAVAEGS
jgi:hypothetical protein